MEDQETPCPDQLDNPSISALLRSFKPEPKTIREIFLTNRASRVGWGRAGAPFPADRDSVFGCRSLCFHCLTVAVLFWGQARLRSRLGFGLGAVDVDAPLPNARGAGAAAVIACFGQ